MIEVDLSAIADTTFTLSVKPLEDWLNEIPLNTKLVVGLFSADGSGHRMIYAPSLNQGCLLKEAP